MTMTNNQRLYWLLVRIGRGDKVENIAARLSQADQLAVVRCAEDDRLLDPADISDPVSTFKKIATALGTGTVILCEDEVVSHSDHIRPCFDCGAAFSTSDYLIDCERCERCEDESNEEADHIARESQIMRSQQL